jgi:hypothetical protein
MVDHNCGVRVEETFVLKEVDEDFFDRYILAQVADAILGNRPVCRTLMRMKSDSKSSQAL